MPDFTPSPQDPLAEQPPHSVTDSDTNELKPVTEEKSQETEDIVIVPCISDSVTFTSFEQMEAQLSAINRLTPADESYVTYSVLNTSKMKYYYTPQYYWAGRPFDLDKSQTSPTDMVKDVRNYTLTRVEVSPNFFIYTYELEGSPGYLKYTISRIPEDDPLADIEARYGHLRNENDWLMVYASKCENAFYVLDEKYLVGVSLSIDLLDFHNIPSESYRFILSHLSHIERTYFMSDTVVK